MIEFRAWPKTPRLFRDMVITEKIDGTNAAVHVVPTADYAGRLIGDGASLDRDVTVVDGQAYIIAAQSRKRVITPDDDNFGFAAWVRENGAGLARALGEGVHYGEWWGSGIQRGYGLEKNDKRFSLFNVNRYTEPIDKTLVPGLGVVPVLDRHTFSTDRINEWVEYLRDQGSYAAPGFDRPEGVVVFHEAAGQKFKVLLENDEQPKGPVA